MKRSYPAIFHKDDSGRFSVLFPDFDAATCGDDLDDAVEMAKECRVLQLKGLRQDGDDFPVPSPLDKIDPAAYLSDLGVNAPSVRLIDVDLDDYNLKDK